MERILILGAGFAGLWAAVGAVRKIAEHQAQKEIGVMVVNRTPYHNIRVRNYEADLSDVRVPLEDVLAPIGAETIVGDVEDIDVAGRRVAVGAPGGRRVLAYDRLVLALGSETVRPPVPGLAEYGFDVDSYEAASRLDRHLKGLGARPPAPGQFTAIVVGAGLTGIEVATALPERLAAARGGSASTEPARIVVVDRQPFVGSDMGPSARPVIEGALTSLRIEPRVDAGILRIETGGVRLTSGEWIDARTVIWCAGMRASPLVAMLPVGRDRLGRAPVDESMRVEGVADLYAAGDVASARIDGVHPSVMSCQHGRPMGRYAGHNVAADLLGAPLLALKIDWYTTILDLGACGAVYTEGWDRRVVATGPLAKATKQTINCKRIYPPLSRRPEEILEAAAPVVHAPPAIAGAPR
jgi:NADH:ubiquinone reductase (H+-translocating)